MPVGNYSYQFFICCPRDCVSRHNGGTSGAPLKPLRVDSALRALSTLRGLRGAPAAPRDASVSASHHISIFSLEYILKETAETQIAIKIAKYIYIYKYKNIKIAKQQFEFCTRRNLLDSFHIGRKFFSYLYSKKNLLFISFS